MRACTILIVLAVHRISFPSAFADFKTLSPKQIVHAPSPRVAAYGAYSCWEFCLTGIDAKGEIVTPKLMEPIRHMTDRDFSKVAREQIVRLRPGITRAAVNKMWSENGGLIPCEFILVEKDAGPDHVGMRIEWRPAAMPERVFADRTLRARWLRRRAPLPAPDDIAMRISHPYSAKCVID